MLRKKVLAASLLSFDFQGRYQYDGALCTEWNFQKIDIFSKLIIKTPEQRKVNNKDIRTTFILLVLVTFLIYT